MVTYHVVSQSLTAYQAKYNKGSWLERGMTAALRAGLRNEVALSKAVTLVIQPFA